MVDYLPSSFQILNALPPELRAIVVAVAPLELPDGMFWRIDPESNVAWFGSNDPPRLGNLRKRSETNWLGQINPGRERIHRTGRNAKDALTAVLKEWRKHEALNDPRLTGSPARAEHLDVGACPSISPSGLWCEDGVDHDGKHWKDIRLPMNRVERTWWS